MGMFQSPYDKGGALSKEAYEERKKVYMDRRGTRLSPAPLRSVAVGASKALMDLYPVKEAQKHELSIGGAGEGGITFNVIVPEQAKEVKPTDDE